MTIALVAMPLYAVLFDENPLPRAEAVAQMFVAQRSPEQLSRMLDEIERELTQPTGEVRAVHDNPQSEALCRDFLREFAAAGRRLTLPPDN